MGSSFLYRKGILCYLSGNKIRVLEVHYGKATEQVIELELLHGGLSRIKLLHFQDGIITFRCLGDSAHSGKDHGCSQSDDPALWFSRLHTPPRATDPYWLYAIDIRQTTSRSERIRFKAFFRERERTCVTNSSQHVCVAVATTPWTLMDYKLGAGTLLPAFQPQMEHASELPEEVTFGIFDECLYAVALPSFDTYKRKPHEAGFFYCYRYPLTGPSPGQGQHLRVWRRAIKDPAIFSNELTLENDERTGHVEIFETRVGLKGSCRKLTALSPPPELPKCHF